MFSTSGSCTGELCDAGCGGENCGNGGGGVGHQDCGGEGSKPSTGQPGSMVGVSIVICVVAFGEGALGCWTNDLNLSNRVGTLSLVLSPFSDCLLWHPHRDFGIATLGKLVFGGCLAAGCGIVMVGTFIIFVGGLVLATGGFFGFGCF